MRDRFHAHIPRLLVDAGGAVLPHPARRVLHLIGEGGRHQHLRQQRIGIERDRTNQIVELIVGETFDVEHLVSWRYDHLCRERREGGRRHQRQRQQRNERNTGHGATPTGDTENLSRTSRCRMHTSTVAPRSAFCHNDLAFVVGRARAYRILDSGQWTRRKWTMARRHG